MKGHEKALTNGRKKILLTAFLDSKAEAVKSDLLIKVNSEVFSRKMFFSLDVSLWKQQDNVSS